MPPNGGVKRGPPSIDRDHVRADSAFQKSSDLVDAKRPPLERVVRRSGHRRSGCRPPAPTTPPQNHTGRRAFGWYHAPLESHPAQRALHGTTPSTRSRCPPRAFSTTGYRTTPAQRAFSTTSVRTTLCTTGFGTMERARRAFKKGNLSHLYEEKE